MRRVVGLLVVVLMSVPQYAAANRTSAKLPSVTVPADLVADAGREPGLLPPEPSWDRIGSGAPIFTDTSRAGLRGLLITDQAPSAALDRSAGEVRVRTETKSNVVIERIEADGLLQMIGTTSDTGVVEVVFGHDVHCDGVSATVVVHDDGSASVELRDRAGSLIGAIGMAIPWAVDVNGVPVPTWFEVEGSNLRQVVDTTSAAVPVTFDPTYTTMSCAGRWNDLSAYWYLSIDAGDTAYCVSSGMFTAANSYTPVWGFETNVANDFGKIALRQDGGCSNSPDTGWAWDFQVPCKAHDYCNDRIFSGDCGIIRDTYYAAVSLPGVVTDPKSGLLQPQTPTHHWPMRPCTGRPGSVDLSRHVGHAAIQDSGSAQR